VGCVIPGRNHDVNSVYCENVNDSQSLIKCLGDLTSNLPMTSSPCVGPDRHSRIRIKETNKGHK
jgi:hypothetical protein